MYRITWLWLVLLAGSVTSYSDYDLWIAARDGDLDEIENALLTRSTISLKGANQRFQDNLWYKHGLGSTALHVASRYNYPHVVSAILDAGFDVNLKDHTYKQSPLHVAVSEEVVNMLIDRGADVDIQDGYGYTPLIQAIVSNHVPKVKALLAANANVSILEGDGYSALHVAAMYNRPALVEYLLEHGAEVNQLSSNGVGRTALDVAKSNKHQEVVDILEVFLAGPPMSDEHKSMLIGILIAVVIVILVILFSLVYYIHRRNRAYNVQAQICRQIDAAKTNTQCA